MRILFILPRMVTGGVERVTLRLVAGLQKRGHECAFALRRAYGEFLPEAEALCPVHEIAAAGLHAFVPNLAKLIHKWQPTHVVTAFADIGILTDMAIRLSGQKPFWAHGVHNTHDGVTATPNFKGNLRFRADMSFAAWVYRRCDVVVAVSNGVREDVLQQFNCRPEKVVTIYNPVLDAGQLSPRLNQSKISSERPRIVALGRLNRQKGFDILIEAMTQVPQPWCLEIWGDGEEKSTLQQAIHFQNLQEHIHLQGHTNQPLEILRQADLFVLSSRYEGLPTILIEALCAQATIVATECPHGPKEILENGRYGILVANESAPALAAGIAQALTQSPPTTAEAMLKRARDFSVNAAVQTWIDVLDKSNASQL